MKRRLLLLSLLVLTGATAPKYKGNWKTDSSAVSAHAVVFEKDEYRKIGRAVPARLFELSDDSVVARGPIGYLGRGTLLVPVDESLKKFCRFERHLGSAFGCLSDADGDGRFESYFGAQVFKEFFTGTVGDEQGHERLIAPVRFIEVDTFLKSPEVNLEFVYLGKSKKAEIAYRFCLSKKITDDKKFYQSPFRKGFSVICSMNIRTPLAEAVTKIQAFGVEMEVVSATEKQLELKIVEPVNNKFETSSSFR